MSSDRRVRSSRANGALSRGPKTEAGKNRTRLNGVKHGIFAKTTILNNESPLFFTKLRNEYYEYLQPANPIERDLVDEMVISKWFCRRAWRLENSTVNYKMDEQAAELAARHTRLMEHSRTSIAYQTLYDNSHALQHIQRSQARNSRMYHRALNKLEDLRRDPPQENEQANPVPDPDTMQPTQETQIVTPPAPPVTPSDQICLSRRQRNLAKRKLTNQAGNRLTERTRGSSSRACAKAAGNGYRSRRWCPVDRAGSTRVWRKKPPTGCWAMSNASRKRPSVIRRGEQSRHGCDSQETGDVQSRLPRTGLTQRRTREPDRLICDTLSRMRLLLLLVLTFSLVFAAELPNSSPAQVGFAPDRLHRIDEVMRDHIASGTLNGASGLISRNGKVVFRQAWGEYKFDTIVRMYSMTKAITGVAAMICYEEGRFSLNDPVSKYMPEFEHMRVGHESTDAAGKRTYYTVPADRPITVRDLFRHTTGLDYAGPKDEKGEPAYKKTDMMGGAPLVPFDLAEAVKRLATAPLNDQPGTMWRYGYSIDVLGRLVEVVSGKTLDQFFEERIFRPLGMKDTAFFVPEQKWSRLAVLYAPKKGGGGLERSTSPAQESFKTRPALLLGGAGSVSTLDDYARFCMMLINDGQLDGVRILGRKTVELMRSDHLGDLPRAGLLPDGYGFGLTFAVNRGPGKTPTVGSQGEYYWGGAAGTSFWLDPKEHMFGVFLINVLPPTGIPAADQFKRMTYQALVD